MSETKILVGFHGAGLTNMLFMQPGGKVLEIRPDGTPVNNCFFTQANALNHHYYYVLSNPIDGDTHLSDFTVDTEKLKSALLCIETDI